MASSRDKVLSGDYKDAFCWISGGVVKIEKGDFSISLNKMTVESYEVLDSEFSKSGTSAVLRAGVGAMFLGPVGLLAGVTAKKKGVYTIIIHFKDGKNSLVEISQKTYKKLLEAMF